MLFKVHIYENAVLIAEGSDEANTLISPLMFLAVSLCVDLRLSLKYGLKPLLT